MRTGLPGDTLELPLGADETLAVVVTNNGNGGTHAGFLYRDEDRKLVYLHLAFHNRLWSSVGDVVPTSGLYSVPKLLAQDENTLLALLDEVCAANHGKLPYALAYTGTTRFKVPSGQVAIGDGCIGLTCSTFVLAMFASIGVELLRLTPWEARDGDVEFRDMVIDLLRKEEDSGKAERGYADTVAQEEGFHRYRPEDVVAAGVVAPPAQAFDRIRQPSQEIRDYILSIE